MVVTGDDFLVAMVAAAVVVAAAMVAVAMMVTLGW
jgi:hypothetical protein